jgi:hypothetical protein
MISVTLSVENPSRVYTNLMGKIIFLRDIILMSTDEFAGSSVLSCSYTFSCLRYFVCKYVDYPMANEFGKWTVVVWLFSTLHEY